MSTKTGSEVKPIGWGTIAKWWLAIWAVLSFLLGLAQWVMLRAAGQAIGASGAWVTLGYIAALVGSMVSSAFVVFVFMLVISAFAFMAIIVWAFFKGQPATDAGSKPEPH